MDDTETFGHYQVLRRPDGSLWELGRGAMGITYRAFDTNLRCHVALKVISAAHLHSEVAGRRFVREARVAARLRHPNIATVYHLGVDPQSFFYSMEFVDGETLQDLVERKGRLPLELVLNVGLQTARALAAAFRQGLIHRDIKPANLMVLQENEEGEDGLLVKVIDFGLARSYDPGDSNSQLTKTGFVGTPLYASPEQLEERDLDIRSDIYSLGITLWILLTGNPPFDGKMTQVITQHLHADPPWWQLGEIPAPARALLERMLKKEPGDRFQGAYELRRAIEDCLQRTTTPDEPPLLASHLAANAAAAPSPLRLSRVPTGRRELKDEIARRLQRAAKDPWKLGSLCAAPVVLVLAYFALRGRPAPPTNSPPKPAHAAYRVATPAPTSDPTPSAVVVPSTALIAAVPVALLVASTPETAMPAPVPTVPPPMVAPAARLEDVSSVSDPRLRNEPGSLPAPPGATEAPAPDVSPTAAIAKDEMGDNAPDDSTDAAAKGSSKEEKHRHTRHGAKATPTPKPNLFQRIFGLKPQPTPKKR